MEWFKDSYLLMVNKNLVLDVADDTYDKGRYISCDRMDWKTVKGAGKRVTLLMCFTVRLCFAC